MVNNILWSLVSSYPEKDDRKNISEVCKFTEIPLSLRQTCYCRLGFLKTINSLNIYLLYLSSFLSRCHSWWRFRFTPSEYVNCDAYRRMTNSPLLRWQPWQPEQKLVPQSSEESRHCHKDTTISNILSQVSIILHIKNKNLTNLESDFSHKTNTVSNY